ncbi:ABC transporter permease, partial [Klebsiella pneumoniae]|nr:ABC transporter permease [Klebsiella pneumoniae]
PVLGLIVGIASGAVIGAMNAGFVSAVRINPFIATLATSMIVRGLALAITGGSLITVTAESFGWLGTEQIASIKLSTWIFLVWAALMG